MRVIRTLVLLCAVFAWTGPAAAADPDKMGTIEGDVLTVDEQTMRVKKADGQEIVLHLSKQTQLGDRFKPGDQVEAFVTPQGAVTSVQPLKGGLRR
ncbi:hypothetical protein [Candidatus Nitrospira bockiana]